MISINTRPEIAETGEKYPTAARALGPSKLLITTLSTKLQTVVATRTTMLTRESLLYDLRNIFRFALLSVSI